MRQFVLVPILFLAACTKIPLALPSGTPLSVSVQLSTEEPRRFELPPSSAKYHQLEEWISNNQYGWSQYLATTPGSAIYVSVAGGRLQFVGPMVLACPVNGACLQKAAKHSEYSFLETQ